MVTHIQLLHGTERTNLENTDSLLIKPKFLTSNLPLFSVGSRQRAVAPNPECPDR